MCVILNIEDGNFPKLSTLKSAESLNSHGGSIAWLEDGKINYHKGLKAKKINKLIQKRLKPKGVETAIIHFRIASVGAVNQKLCHPFQISEESRTDLKVMDCDYDLLFHNGTVTDWQEVMINQLQGQTVTLPKGELSDSRAMAYLLSIFDYESLLNTIDGWNKFSILTKDGIKKFGQWTKVDGIECSNDYFDKNSVSFYSYNDDYADVEYVDDIDEDIKSKQKWNSKYGLGSRHTGKKKREEENEEYDLNGICKTDSDFVIYKKIQKAGMEDDTISYYYDSGMELEEILHLAEHPYYFEGYDTEEEYLRAMA